MPEVHVGARKFKVLEAVQVYRVIQYLEVSPYAFAQMCNVYHSTVYTWLDKGCRGPVVPLIEVMLGKDFEAVINGEK